MKRLLIALILTLHGLIHLIGVMTYWKLTEFEDLPDASTLLDGRFEVGTTLALALGALWLVAMVGFIFGAVGFQLKRTWWPPALLSVTFLSLILCLLAGAEARMGVAFNVVIVAVFAVQRLWPRAEPRAIGTDKEMAS